MAKIHYRNLRLFINAGIEIPECKAYAKLLDLDSGLWKITPNKYEVTCKNCIQSINKKKH